MTLGFGLTVGKAPPLRSYRRGGERGLGPIFDTFEGLPDMNTESTERDRRRITSPRPLAGLSLAAPLVLVGCSHAPEYSIFGSFFPVWIFCSAGGLMLAAGARVLIARSAIAEHLAAPVLFYLGMATFLACMLWLLFYS
jgi:YtcA family